MASYRPESMGKQPGLEVYEEYSGLQVDHNAAERNKLMGSTPPGYPPQGIYGNGLEVIGAPDHPNEPFQTNAPSPETTKPSRRRRWIIIGVVVLLVVVVAAVVGGVMGSRAANDNKSGTNDDSSNTNGDTPSTTSTREGPASPSPTGSKSSTIAPGSQLSAVGWKGTGDSSDSIFVAFYNPDGSLVYTRSEKDKYTSPQPLKSEFQLQDESPMAMTALAQFYGGTWGVQLELFYLNTSSRVNGVNYNTGDGGKGRGFGDDSVNKEEVTSITGGQLSAYWPLVLFQDIGSDLRLLVWTGASNGPWYTTGLPMKAKDKTQLAIVPLTRNSSRVTHDGWIGVIYQDEKGKLTPRANPLDTKRDGFKDLSPVMDLWSTDKFPDITLGDESSLAAFSVARTDSSTDRVDTYILYQDESSDIKQVWLDNDKGWQTSSPEALAKADRGTDIVCITTPSWTEVPEVGERFLDTASNLNRCYFQKDDELVEVVLDGQDWKGPNRVFPDDD